MKFNDRIRAFLLKCTYSQKLAVVLFCTFISFLFVVGGLRFTSQSLYNETHLDARTFNFQVQISRLSNLLAIYQVESIRKITDSKDVDDKMLSKIALEIDNEVDQFFLTIRAYIKNENSKIFRHKIEFHIEEVESFVSEWEEYNKNSTHSTLPALAEKYNLLVQSLSRVQSKLWTIFRLYENDDEGTKRLIDVNFDTMLRLTKQTSNFLGFISREEQGTIFKSADLYGFILNLNENMSQIKIRLNGISGLIDLSLQEDTHNYFNKTLERLSEVVDAQTALALIGETQDKNAAYTTVKTALELYREIQEKINGILEKLYKTQAHTLAFRLYTGYILVLLALFTVLIIYFAKVVLQPLKHLSDAANELAIGKVNVRVPIFKHDEVGEISEAFNALATFLEDTLREVKGVSNHLLKAVQEILGVARKLEENIAIQDAELNVIKGHIKEIAVVVKEFTLLLNNVYKSINATAGFADVGRKSLSEMEYVMKQIVGASQSIVTTLNSLNTKICSINDVINTIVKIADQINLLSLNTAIQANKAGPEGKGFTIIAKKIRELSGQTAFSTLDIEDTVREIVTSVDSSTTEVNLFLEQIHHQVKDSTMLSDEFKKLIHFFQHQVEVFSSVNEDMSKQADSATELQVMLRDLSQASKRTTLSVGQFYREIESLHQSTNSLVQKIDSFTHPSYILLAKGESAVDLAIGQDEGA